MSTIGKIKLLLAVVIIAFVTAAGYISALVVQRQSALEQVSRYNVAWLLSQGATEYARLEQRLSAFGSGDGDVTDEEVQLRFDIVANRVKLFEHGNVVEYLDGDPEQHATVRELSQVIDAVRPLIDNVAKPGNALKVQRLLAPLDGKMVRLAAAGNRWGGERVAEDQRQLMSLHWKFSALAGGLIVCGILLMTLLFWHNRMLAGAHRDLRVLAEELRGQEQTAIAASRAKSEFLAMMSHEIRTPMNAVIGLSAVLINSNLDREAHHLANSIHDSSNSLLRLLNDILDISKLDAGKVELEMQSFSLTVLIDGAISIFEGQALKKGLLVRTFVDDELPIAVVGDESRLRQVVLNLMSNAIKFTDSGSVEVSVRCLAVLSEAAKIEVSVTDTGIGIAPDKTGSLFSDFLQVDSSINRRYGGTGLGLAISKRIIEQMGGEIRVESTLNVGSTFAFTLTLPLADACQLADNNPMAAGDEFERKLAALEHPLAVLLAEDNATNQLVFTKLMQGYNVDITVASNGLIALEQASAFTFDVVFMDMRMPKMDGLDATRAIRALDGARGRVPIIALTANAFADDIKACRDAGMDEFIAKPVRRKMLLEKLASLLAGHAHFQEAARVQTGPQEHGTVPDDRLPVTPPAEIALVDVAPVLDRAALDMLVEEIDIDGVRATLDVFLAETVERLAQLRRMSCEDDRSKIEGEAHTLKGSSSTFGLRQISELARTLEYSAHQIAPDDYRDLLDRLDACFDLARDELTAAMTERVG